MSELIEKIKAHLKRPRKTTHLSRSFRKTWFGRCIYQKNQVYVFQNWFYRWLTFESKTIQTLIHRRDMKHVSLSYIRGFLLPIQYRKGNICLLGLGGAGLVHALGTLPEPPSCLAIEHDSTVIEIARAYFFIDQLNFLKIEEQDAYTFIEHTTLTFDHLWVDLFHSTTFPEHCNGVAFVKKCQSRLNSCGILAVNFADFSQQKPLFQALKASFEQAMVLVTFPDASNIVALCFNETNLQPFLSQLRENHALKSLSWQPGWGYVACF